MLDGQISNVGSGSASRFDLLNVDLRSRPLLNREYIPAGLKCHLVLELSKAARRATPEFGCQAIVVVDRKICRGRGQSFATRLVARSASGTKDFKRSAICIPYARCAILSVPKAVCARSALSSYTFVTLFCDIHDHSDILPAGS
jgi:hypothetical protein